jgi:carboxylate-amine ligase
MWRAIRYGADGRLVDFRKGVEVEARAAIEELVEWTAPAREELGLDVKLPERNGAQRARAGLADGRSIKDVYRDTVEETRRTYVAEEVLG